MLTYVGAYDEELALGAVRRELLREGQVFWVHNRVATIDRQARHGCTSSCPRPGSSSAHGQMDEDAARDGGWSSSGTARPTSWCAPRSSSRGLDVPNANTLIVDRADASGSRRCTSCAVASGARPSEPSPTSSSPTQREMTEEAHERLATIAKHQALGSGFKIALRDLEIRGAGNMLGAEQSGHIAAVGFDAYARILAESVNELRGAPVEQESELRIDLPVKAFIPPGWLAQESLRLELYRRIGMARDHEGLAMIRDETADRFGALPDPSRSCSRSGRCG